VLAPYGNPPLSNREAWAAYEALLADDRVMLRADEPPGIEARWRELTLRDTASPKLWMDAYLAAFSISAGYRMVTTDAAFGQFPGLDLVLVA
jgi:predicted nucleic acid-binding protein